MAEEKPTGLKNEIRKAESFKIWKWVAISICIFYCGIFIWGYTYYRTEIRETYALYMTSHQLNIQTNKQLQLSEAQVKLKSQELEKMKKMIAGIKDRDDLMKRDIKFYIKTTHPQVPNIIAKTIAENVVVLSKKHNVSPEIVIGIIKVESLFDPMAVGPKTKHGHARGLMQVMPEWYPKFGLKTKYELHNIDIGIESGIKVFLIHLEEAKGDISTGLYYYVNKDKAYVGKVYAAMGKFVAFRSTVDDEKQNVETDIEDNGNSNNDKKGDDDARTGKSGT